MASCSLGCTMKELEDELIDTGEKLLTPPSSTDELLHLLDKAENLLSKVGQDPPGSIREALLPLMTALTSNSLHKHSDINAKISVVSCISEVSKITAPDAPYGDNLMREIFKLVVMAFEKLSDASGRCYSKAVNILENAARVRFCVLLLDLQCEALLIQIFQLFLNTIRVDHPHSIFKSMETIMTSIIQESDEISPELLKPILESLKRENQNASPISLKLAVTVLRNCSARIKPYLRQAVELMSLNFDDYAGIVASVCEDAPHTIKGGEEFAMDGPHPVEVGLSEDGLSKLVLENGSAQTRNSNNMPNEKNSLRKSELCDQLKNADVQRYRLNGIGDVQPEDDAGTCPPKGASGEPASKNAASKTKEGSFGKAEGKKERSLQRKSNKSTIENHGTEEVGGKVSASLHTVNLVDNDDNFSEKCAKKNTKRKAAPQMNEVSKKRRVKKGVGEELVGSRIKVWWPLDQRFYEGTVSSFDPSKKKHKVWYTDGEEENLNLNKERWELFDDALIDKEQKGDVRSPRVSCSKNSKKQAKVKVESSKEQELTNALATRSED